MDTYLYWLNGRPGYCFELARNGWWFVSEQGQTDNKVRPYLSLEDIVFCHQRNRQYENRRRYERQSTPWWLEYLQAIFLPKLQSVAGLLLLLARSL